MVKFQVSKTLLGNKHIPELRTFEMYVQSNTGAERSFSSLNANLGQM